MYAIVIASDFGEVRIVDEPTYTFGSADNTRLYGQEIDLGRRGISTRGVLVDDAPVLVVGGTGGANSVHEHCALILNSRLYLAVGDTVACLGLDSHELAWSLQVDTAACFGIHYHPARRALLSHGELDITRFDEAGRILWTWSGADILTGAFRLDDEYIAVVDFNDQEYHLSYETGEPV
jgi:hypothetical protein